MAIEFARSERISRGSGGNAVRLAAYATRATVRDERTGETHNFKDDGTLQHAEVLLPDGADTKFLDVATLFNAIERAEHRKDAQVARVIVIALPGEVSPAERIEMAQGFARQQFTDKGLPVLVCLHSPHAGGNHHAHLIGGTRQLEPDGFAVRKVREAMFTRVFGRPLMLQGDRERVGELWRDFQNKWFAEHGKAILVDPISPVPQEHIGPIRFRAPDDDRIAHNNQVREFNAQIARDPDAVVAHLRSRAQPFDGRALDRFLTKHLPFQEREAVGVEVNSRLRQIRREALEKAAVADRVPSGWRDLTVEDVARSLSPEYAALSKKARALTWQLTKASAMIDANEAHREDAAWNITRRWEQLGLLRRALHTLGTFRNVEWLQDIELRQQAIRERQAEWGAQRWGIRRREYLDTCAAADAALENIRPAAQQELDRRQKIAQRARVVLENRPTQNIRLTI